MNKNWMRGRRCSGELANGSEAHIHQGVSGELLRRPISPVIGQLKWAGSALGQRIRALLSSAAGGAHASLGPHAYVLAFGNGLEGFAVDKQKECSCGLDRETRSYGTESFLRRESYEWLPNRATV